MEVIGRTIHPLQGISDIITTAREFGSLFLEKRRLEGELVNAEQRFKDMLRGFGGPNGNEVTIAQVGEYLVRDMDHVKAFVELQKLIYPNYQSPNLPKVERAQRFHDLGGREAAIARLTEDQDINAYNMMGLKDPVEQARIDIAYEAAVRLLTSL